MKAETIRDYAREYMNIADQIAELQERKNALRDKFIAEIGLGNKDKFGPYTVTCYTTSRPNMDIKAVMENMPEVYEIYGKPDIVSNQVRMTKKA